MIDTKMIVEVAIFAIGIYAILRFLRETRGSNVVRGLSVILLMVVVSFTILIQQLELDRLEVIFNKLTELAVLGLIIVFQPEIRRAIVHLGDSQLFGRFFKREVKTTQRLLRSVARLSKERIGALIAIEREGSLASLSETGIQVDAELNSYLIEAIFYPGGALHDGALVIRGDRLVAASCLLPLSQNPSIDKRLGTRHRAAIGLTEETDSLAIVVSEETGKISTALGGRLDYGISLEGLENTIEQALGLTKSTDGRRGSGARSADKRASPLRLAAADPWRKAAAVALGVLLWFALDNQITETKDFPLPLYAVALNGPMPEDRSVHVAIDRNQFFVDGFYDRVMEREIGGVTLDVRGAKHEIAALDENPGWRVTPNLSDITEQRASVEFTAEDLRAIEPRFQGLEIVMTPASVRVDVIKTTRHDFLLTPSLLQISASPDILSRIRKNQAEFNPAKAITLVGPADQIQLATNLPVLFEVDLADALPETTEIAGTVRLIDDERIDRVQLATSETITVTIPLTVAFKRKRFDIPINIDTSALPKEIQDQFTARDSYASIEIQYSHNLDNTLLGMDAEQAQDYMWEFARLWVRVPPNTTTSTSHDSQFIFTGQLFQEGLDYKVLDLPSVTVERIQ